MASVLKGRSDPEVQAQRRPEIRIYLGAGEAGERQPWGWREEQLRGGRVDLSDPVQLKEQKG